MWLLSTRGRFGILLVSATTAMMTGLAAQPMPSASPPALPTAGVIVPNAPILVPKGTVIVVSTMQSYNSYSAKTGGKVRYEVVQDVIVDGHVIAKEGDAAQGAVQEGQAGEVGVFGIGNKSANLRVSVDEVYSYCGDTVHVDFDRSEYRRRQGAFGSNKDVHIIKGQKYAAVTDRVQRVCGDPTSAIPKPIPSDAITTSSQ